MLSHSHQQKYREGLFDVWQNACAVTSLSVPRLLRASHAKPWEDASDEERLDPCNGLLLSPDMDALFDSGLITFDDDGQMLLSPTLPASARQAPTSTATPPSAEPPHPNTFSTCSTIGRRWAGGGQEFTPCLNE